MSLAEYGDAGTRGPGARGLWEHRRASRVAGRSAGRGERAAAARAYRSPPAYRQEVRVFYDVTREAIEVLAGWLAEHSR